ncbi:MAG: ribonucleoside-triphosphate reductase [Candidatus Bathyarchaeota archaeon]|nr:ribonucleoside-triphosphate reductase [Candidatus Bathyarchaeota archaeon]
MSLKERLIDASKTLPATFEEQKDGTLKLEFKVAERKVFLSKKTLTYRAKLRVDEAYRVVKLFEILKETGLGVSSGDSDMSPGFGFKVETYKTTGKQREGTIEELSKLFGKDYKYSWDYSTVRKMVEQEANKMGYALSVVLLEKSV